MFLLLVFLIVCVLYSRTCLSFVVAFIAENRQLFFFFDILKNVKKEKSLNKSRWVFAGWTTRMTWVWTLDSITDTWLSPLPFFTPESRAYMSTGAVLNYNACVAFHGILSHLEILWSLYALAFLQIKIWFFFLSGEGYKKKRQKRAGTYLDCFSILYSSDSSLVQVILDACFIKFKHKTKAHHQVARWKEVFFAPYHKAPCGEVLSCGCCLGHLWMMYPPCWGHDSCLPCSTVWHSHASGFIQGLWWNRLARRVLYYNTCGTVKIRVNVQIACGRKKCINEKNNTNSTRKKCGASLKAGKTFKCRAWRGKSASVTKGGKTNKSHIECRRCRKNIIPTLYQRYSVIPTVEKHKN